MSNKKLTLAFSSCPNDTFMFDAMVNKKIDTEDFEFDCHIADIEELNNCAFKNTYDISKVSFHAFLYLVGNYKLLASGAALGENVGPLLISKNSYSLDEISNLTIAIPGECTTAAMLLKMLLPQPKSVVPLLFSDIENAVISGKVNAGVIIHENRFTYAERGLHKMADLGEVWTNKTKQPIPLGGIIIKRDLPSKEQKAINRILRRSIEFAFQNPESSFYFVKKYAQEMDEVVMQKHIKLYVNQYSLNLDVKGQAAIEFLFQLATQKQIIQPQHTESLFVD